MRAVLRKIYRQEPLNEAELQRLADYADDLGKSSSSAYKLFIERFGTLLFKNHNLYLSPFYYGFDNWIDFLLSHPEIRQELSNRPMAPVDFPIELRDFLQYSYGDQIDGAALVHELEADLTRNNVHFDLPVPRQTPVICKYESGNPFKESGLKAHFDRIERYSFVSRIQSIRYLTGHKASEDRLELVSADCLGGIFTNKEKSIYYYVFLTEKDNNKALNACRVLNKALYGYHAKL